MSWQRVSLKLMAINKFWQSPLSRQAIAGNIVIPGSKSLTNRELILSALANSPSTLIKPLRSRDSDLMIAALQQLGIDISWQGNDILVNPGKLSGGVSIDCGLAGTVMRFVPPLAGLATGEVGFDGDAHARNRPMQTTIDSLRSLGVKVSDSQNLPFTVFGSGEIAGGQISIDASSSSQFVSGLLLAAARFRDGLLLTHSGDSLPSLPHIEMTLDCLRGRSVDARSVTESSWQVVASEISGRDIEIEPDLSNAGPFLAAAMVAGGEVVIPDWPRHTTQVGNEYLWILKAMGAEVDLTGTDLTIRGTGEIQGIELNLGIGGELTPTIAALAALADSPSKLTGIAHLRGHETDRLKALVTEINRIGGSAVELADGLEIFPAKIKGGKWFSYQDHRMATSGAIIGLRHPIEIENIETTAKTMPGFAQLWTDMVNT